MNILTTAVITFMSAVAISAQVRYTVRFPNPSSHYASVTAVFPASGRKSIDLFMPVWTPGSYLVREYARNVEDLRAGGLPAERTTKNRWRIETRGASEVKVDYQVYCREMSVRTNWVEDSFALLNGAPTFIALVGGGMLRHEVSLELPSAWKTTATGLDPVPGGTPHRYTAPDYDTLVDSPILAGNPAVHRFEVDGIPHLLVSEGEEGVFDGERAAADFEKIVRHNRAMWGSLPYRHYVVLNLITEAGGGLEHRNSVCMMTSRWATRTRRGYLNWLDLASHEYFHAWNVKRLRPVELGPFDYETENPTRSLWIAEGITDYYAPLNVLRSGLMMRSEYLGAGPEGPSSSLSNIINTLQTTPGRLVQSAEQASFDAWIKAYRPDENSGNTSISYYTKGTVVGWLLDARIREATGGARSLDDLMRLAYERFSGAKGFTPSEFKKLAAEVAGAPLDEFFHRAVESTEELDYEPALNWFGLRFREPAGGAKKAWLGAETRNDAGRLIVTRIVRNTPAAGAGLNVDDEIIALGDFRVRADQFAARLENFRPGETVSLLVARREKLTRLKATFGEEPPRRWVLEVRPGATPAQKQHLENWLKPL